MPYRKARNSTDDHYAAPVTIYVNGCVLEACRIEASRLKWARSGAGRTESYVKAPSLATSGQVRHPGFGKDLPGHVGVCRGSGSKSNNAAPHDIVGCSQKLSNTQEGVR